MTGFADVVHAFLQDQRLAKGIRRRPPGSGWEPIPHSRRGGIRRRKGDTWEYWYAGNAKGRAGRQNEPDRTHGAGGASGGGKCRDATGAELARWRRSGDPDAGVETERRKAVRAARRGGSRHPADTFPDEVGAVRRGLQIHEVEAAIRGEGLEHLVIFAPDGRQVLRKRGEYDRLPVSGEETSALRAVGGVVITHNHPVVAPFSPADIVMAIKTDAAAIRVVLPTGETFSIVRPRDGWGRLADNTDATLMAFALMHELGLGAANKRMDELVVAAGGNPHDREMSIGYDGAKWARFALEAVHEAYNTALAKHGTGVGDTAWRGAAPARGAGLGEGRDGRRDSHGQGIHGSEIQRRPGAPVGEGQGEAGIGPDHGDDPPGSGKRGGRPKPTRPPFKKSSARAVAGRGRRGHPGKKARAKGEDYEEAYVGTRDTRLVHKFNAYLAGTSVVHEVGGPPTISKGRLAPARLRRTSADASRDGEDRRGDLLVPDGTRHPGRGRSDLTHSAAGAFGSFLRKAMQLGMFGRHADLVKMPRGAVSRDAGGSLGRCGPGAVLRRSIRPWRTSRRARRVRVRYHASASGAISRTHIGGVGHAQARTGERTARGRVAAHRAG
jgi:hypothetical protein